jgi:uncharacterized SAM-binding protein YcdF (DUF218 family)
MQKGICELTGTECDRDLPAGDNFGFPPVTSNRVTSAPAATSLTPVAAPRRPRRWLLRVVWLAAIVAVLLVAAYVFRAPLLVDLARIWIVNQPVAHADAIVILGGGVENRPFAAAKLFHDGVAPRILYMDVRLDPAEQLGIAPSEKDVTRRILLSNGVPESAIQAIGSQVTNTYDESRAVRAWASQTGATSIVIATELFHTRRARWIFRHELRGTPVMVHVVAVDPVRYKIGNWWRNEEGLIQFQNEVIKSVYYWFEY